MRGEEALCHEIFVVKRRRYQCIVVLVGVHRRPRHNYNIVFLHGRPPTRHYPPVLRHDSRLVLAATKNMCYVLGIPLLNTPTLFMNTEQSLRTLLCFFQSAIALYF